MVHTLVQIKITSAVCSFFAVALTCLRLYLRRDRYWWDDACAFLSTVFLLLQVAAVFMHLQDPRVLTHLDNIAAYYIMAASFYAIIWTARLAILYSVIRIDPNPKTRLILHRVGIVFIVVLCVMIAQLFWVCEPLPKWKNALSPQCPLDKQVAICQLVTDVLADLLLIAAPLRLIWGMSSEDGTRKRLMVIFSTSIVTTIVSLVHAALILSDAGAKVVIAALVEDTFSLIVCNLPVVVTAAMRRGRARTTPSGRSASGGVSTFGWRVASRKPPGGGPGATTIGSVDSGTAAGLTTVTLRELRAPASPASPQQQQRRHPALRFPHPEDEDDEDDDASVLGAPPKEPRRRPPQQQEGAVWLAPEKFYARKDGDDK